MDGTKPTDDLPPFSARGGSVTWGDSRLVEHAADRRARETLGRQQRVVKLRPQRCYDEPAERHPIVRRADRC